mgnify:CR=1 FL=1
MTARRAGLAWLLTAGLSVAGAAGVQAVMEHLHEEMVRAMRLSGTPSLADATPDLVMR